MKNLLLIFVCICCIAAHAQKHLNQPLKRQLDSMMILDQKYRETITLLMTPGKADATAKTLGLSPAQALNHYWKLQNAIDSTNILFVEHVIDKHGYPGKSLVGDSTNEAAWYIIQHSPKIDKYIPIVKKAADARELKFSLYAMMLDRYLMNKNQEQVYGTQSTMRTLKATGKNEWIVWPIKDPAHVNQLRKKAGFPDTVEENATRMEIKYKVMKLGEVLL
jgi:hypothetical protein